MTPEQREAVRNAVAEALGEAYDCTRVWSAWSYNTMGPDDFSLVGEDSDRVAEIADAAIQAMPQQAAAPAGWKLVPIEPTDAMREAASKADDDGFEAGRSYGASGMEIYASMIAAAPLPPVPEGE